MDNVCLLCGKTVKRRTVKTMAGWRRGEKVRETVPHECIEINVFTPSAMADGVHEYGPGYGQPVAQ